MGHARQSTLPSSIRSFPLKSISCARNPLSVAVTEQTQKPEVQIHIDLAPFGGTEYGANLRIPAGNEDDRFPQRISENALQSRQA